MYPLDRFDVAEAVACLAHDYGCYGVYAHLEHGWQFRPRPNLTFDTLTDNGLRLYYALEPRAKATLPYDSRFARVS